MTFWILAPLMVAAALGILFVRKAVHAALLLAVVMISLALLYAVLDAPFLFAVQIIVYTGAILMLFLFVMMLIGVDTSDSIVETIRGQRAMAVVLGLVFGTVLVLGISQVTLGTVVGLDEANAGGNVPAVANILFSRYVFAFEATSALLITAALGAMVLAHRERLAPKATQADQAAQRLRDYAEHGKHLGPLPSPGVYARHNAVDTPALLPDGTAAESVPPPRCPRPRARPAPPRPPKRTSRRACTRDPVHRPLGDPLHDRLRGCPHAPQRHRGVHVRRADAQRLQPGVRGLRPAARQPRRTDHRLLRDGRGCCRGRDRARDHHDHLPHPTLGLGRRRQPAEVLREHS